MAAGTVGSRKRERPEDGGMEWMQDFHAFHCLGCGGYEEIRRRGDRTPEKLAELRELLVMDHTECWEYDDPRMAEQARRFRREVKRQKNLAAQKTGWRGRT